MTTHQTRCEEGRADDEDRSGLLRLVLKLDAVASGALGALPLAASPALDDLLGTPLALLVPVGAFWFETIEGFAGVKGGEMRDGQ